MEQYLTLEAVAKLYGFHKRTIMEFVKSGKNGFPKPVYPTGSIRHPRWNESDIVKHQEQISRECYKA